MTDLFKNDTPGTATKLHVLAFSGNDYDGPTSSNFFDFGTVGWNVTPAFTTDVRDYYTFTPYKLKSIKISFDADSVGDFVSILGAIPISGVSKVEGDVIGTWYGGVHTKHHEITDDPGPYEPDFRPTPDRAYVENGAEDVLNYVKNGGINKETGHNVDWSGATWSDNEFPGGEAVWYLTGEPVIFRFFGLEGRGTTAQIDAKNNVPDEASYDFKIFPKSGEVDAIASKSFVNDNSKSELLTGGAGRDTYKAGGARDDFSVVKKSTGTVTVKKKSGGEPDNLVDIERVEFSDGALLFDMFDANGVAAYKLYGGAFARTPDEAGVLFWKNDWLDAGRTLLEAANIFVQSAEFIAKYGNSISNQAFVDQLYLNILNRPGEEGGRNYWRDGLNDGTFDRATVLVNFTQLAEYSTIVGAQIDDGMFVV